MEVTRLVRKTLLLKVMMVKCSLLVRYIEYRKSFETKTVCFNLFIGKQSHYHFTREGKYYLTVTNVPSVRHTIVVVERDIVNITEDYLQQQCVSVSREDNMATATDCDECMFKNDVSEGLLFSHASIMSVSFGILIPVGALLAANGSPFAHKVVQPGGIVLVLVGYGLVLAYLEVEEKGHFNTVHSYVGFCLVLVIVLMPFIRLRKELHYVHKKCGVVIVFYGMTNVLLVSMLYS